jgi:two-component system, sensor histidine kinase and response regulator
MTSDLIFRLDREGRCVFAGATAATNLTPALPTINTFVAAWAATPDDATQWTDAIRHVTETGEMQELLLALSVRDQIRFYQAYLTPERQDNITASIFVVLRDVTEMLRREQDLSRQNAALNEALNVTQQQNLRSIGLGADLGHELRAPLTNIISLLDLLAASSLETSQMEWVTAARSSARALLKLTNDVLELALIEARRIRLETAELSLTDLVRDVVVLFAHRAQERNLDLIVRIDPSLPSLLRGDAGRIRQVLSNLLDNALKFTAQGYVLIDVAKWEETAQRVMLQIEVEDSGAGVPADRRERIFERFAQGATAGEAGSGLGLAISRQLAMLMQGSLNYVSRPGTGAVFQFCVPLEQSNTETLSAADELQAALMGRAALIVDGSYLRQCVLYEMIRAWGMYAEVRSTTAELRLVLERPRHPFDVIVLDEDIWHALQQEAPLTIAKMPRFVLLSSPLNETESPDNAPIPLSAVVSKPTFAQTLGETLLTLREQETGDREQNNAEGTGENTADTGTIENPRVVLVVDDDPISRQMTAGVVRASGYAVREAADGAEVLSIADSQPFQAVLMDVRLPDMDPRLLMDELFRRGDDKIRFAFLTAYTPAELPEELTQSDADAILTKPLTPEAFVRLMSDAEQETPTEQTTKVEAEAEEQNELSSVLNRELLWERVGRVPGILRSLIDLVKAQLPPLVAEMRSSLQNHDVPAVLRAAHQVRGMMMSLYAEGAAEAVRRYEQAVRDNNTAAILTADAALDAEMLRLEMALDRMLAETETTEMERAF